MGFKAARLLGAMLTGAMLSFIGPAEGLAAAASNPAAPARPAQAAQEVDVALVLAIDVSVSIDYEEAELQRKGIAEAFLSREVIRAIQSGSLGRIGVSAVYFSSRSRGWMSVPVPWTVVRDQKSAEEFVRSLLSAERRSGRGTSISDALELSARMLAISPFQSAKQVIDVSGDGANNAGRPVTAVRDEVLAKGITINALPIIDETTPQDLDKYFQGCVIGGPASFVIPAKGFADFAVAMRRKLVLEISGLTPEEAPSGSAQLRKVAAAPAPAAPGRPAVPPRGFAPRNPPYPGGCDFPLFGGFGGFGGFGNFPGR